MSARKLQVMWSLSGWPRHGKSALAAALVKTGPAHGCPCVRVGYGDALKHLADLLGIPQERAPLQHLGTSVRTAFNTAVLCGSQALANVLTDTLIKGHSVAADDPRNLEELQHGTRQVAPYFPEVLFRTIRVHRPGAPIPDHPLEHLLDNATFDFYVSNDGDLTALEDKAHALWATVRTGKISPHWLAAMGSLAQKGN